MEKKLTSDGINCCTPKGQLRRYVDCKGCDNKPIHMEKKLTAVDYFIEQLEAKGGAWENASIRRLQISIDVTDYLDLKRQALELGKEQILEAMKVAMMPRLGDVAPEDYYTQNYGK